MEQRSNVRLPGYLFAGPSPLTANVARHVDSDEALRHDAYWACVTRISADVAMFPVDLVSGGRGRMDSLPVPEIIAAPSALTSPLDWRQQVVAAWLTHGRIWGMVTKVNPVTLRPDRIELRDESAVEVRAEGGRVRFYVDQVEQELWPLGNLWWEPGHTLPSHPLGLSVVQYHAATIGRGLAAGKFGSDLFTDGGIPPAIITAEDDPGEEAAKTIKEKILAAMRGNREPLVLPAGLKYERIQVDPDDSQFIETMRYSVEQICRIFGEDPADYGSSNGGSSVTYANRIDADVARIKRRQWWVTKLQAALTRLTPDGVSVRLNTAASLMMTPAEQHDVFAKRLESRTMTVNEVRVIVDETPFGPEFDTPGIPPLTTTPANGGRDLAEIISAEVRAALPPPAPAVVERGGDTHIHLPDALTVHNDDALRAVADLASEVRDLAQREQLPPQVTVNVPETVVTVNVPEQPAPQVTVNVPEQPVQLSLDMPTPVINVPAPVVTVVDGGGTKKVKLSVGGKSVTGTIEESSS